MFNDLKQNYHDLRACNDYSKELGAFTLLCYSRENGSPQRLAEARIQLFGYGFLLLQE
jgi:hypothetical protein